MSKVLIISPNFPPANKISSLRPYYLARAFSRRGLEVDVFSCVSLNGSLQRAEEGLSVFRMGGSSFRWLISVLLSLLRFRIRGDCYSVVLSTYGPSVSHIVGLIAKIIWPHAIWVADYRDLWTTGYYYKTEITLTEKIKRWVEKLILLPAELIMSVSPSLLQHLTKFHRKSGLLMYNGFEKTSSEAVDGGGQVLPNAGAIRVVYTGTIYPERSPAGLLEAILRVKHRIADAAVVDLRIIFAGYVDPGVKKQIQGYMDIGLVEILGSVDRSVAYQLQLEADFLLLIETPEATALGVLTGKLFEYLGTGNPIIAVGVSHDSDMYRLLDGRGCAAYVGLGDGSFELFVDSLLKGQANLKKGGGDVSEEFERERLSDAAVSAILRRTTLARKSGEGI